MKDMVHFGKIGAFVGIKQNCTDTTNGSDRIVATANPPGCGLVRNKEITVGSHMMSSATVHNPRGFMPTRESMKCEVRGGGGS